MFVLQAAAEALGELDELHAKLQHESTARQESDRQVTSVQSQLLVAERQLKQAAAAAAESAAVDAVTAAAAQASAETAVSLTTDIAEAVAVRDAQITALQVRHLTKTHAFDHTEFALCPSVACKSGC